mgnify:CR=1 FL=1
MSQPSDTVRPEVTRLVPYNAGLTIAEVVARYADRDILQSGWLLGEQTIAKKAAMVAAQLGQGRVILIGFRVQHRAQTYGAFKLLFNALVR